MGFELGLGFLGGALGFGTSLLNFGQKQNEFEHMKAMQEKAWMREDNAVQRRVADLKAANINPMLAAGQAASSSQPIQVHAPQMESRAFEQANMGLHLGERKAAIDHTKAQTMLNQVQAKKTQAEINFTNEQTRRMSQTIGHEGELHPLRMQEMKTGIDHTLTQIRQGNVSIREGKQRIINLGVEETLQRERVSLTQSQRRQVEAQIEELLYDLNYWRNLGLSTSGAQSTVGRTVADSIGMSNRGYEALGEHFSDITEGTEFSEDIRNHGLINATAFSVIRALGSIFNRR